MKRRTLLLILTLLCTCASTQAQMGRRQQRLIEEYQASLRGETIQEDTVSSISSVLRTATDFWKRLRGKTTLDREVEALEQCDTTVAVTGTEPQKDTALLNRLTQEYLRLLAEDSETSAIRYAAVRNGLYDDPWTVLHIEWFLVQHPSATDKILSRYSRYEEEFRAVFDLYGVPPDLAALCIVESAVNTGAVSPAGAVGMWQFMEGTARGCGLRVNGQTDERLDPHKSARAAALYLGQLCDRLGDWSLAVAAYNCGAGRVEKAIRKAGSRDYADIKKYLPDETQDYLPRLVAAIYVVEQNRREQ